MGKPIVREFDQSKTILKYFDYKGSACVVSSSGVSADENGNKIVKAGTPFPANDSTCKGYLLHDVDVTQGDAPGTFIVLRLNERPLQQNTFVLRQSRMKAKGRKTGF